jgi:uncharacterized membrane protein YgdD (TMEM256/DUF423 family)
MRLEGRRRAAGGALLAALAIAAGAFGAHGLEGRLDARALEWWRTGAAYQLWNAIGLVALAGLPGRLRLPAVLIGIGAIVFSFSLYAMALTGATWLGMVTPLGGLAMILGWLLAAIRFALS